jgi:hypothetical protein
LRIFDFNTQWRQQWKRHKPEQKLKNEHNNEVKIKFKIKMNLGTGMDMDTGTRHGHGHRISVTPSPTLKSTFGANLIIVSPYNLYPTAPA